MAIDVTEIKIRDKVTIAGSEITSVESTLTGSSTAIPRADAVKGYVDTSVSNIASANDAMVFKGTIGTGGTVTALPTTHSVGWTYRVITAGTYAGVATEVGDLIIALISRSGSGNQNSDWTVVQTNIDGAVTGPASAVSANVASFNGTGGKIIQDSGVAFETTLTTGSDAKSPTSKAVATYVTGLGYVTSSGVTAVTGTAPIASSGGATPSISITAATTSAAGSMSSADKTKLDGIATGATANSADATLLARGNHTGTQTASTISDFATAVAATASVTANTAKVTNATHTGDVTGATALTIANNAVTFAKMQDIDTARILGRVTASAGDPEALTATQVRTMINVADGATANAGTVTSVGGTGTVAGLTLTGTVTTSGNLTLGGTLSTPVSTINDSTTVGQNLVKLTNPSAITFLRVNADNTVTALSDSNFRTAIGAGTGSGTVTGVTGTSPIVSSGGTAPVISITAATTSAAGSMSSADKTKLDGIASGAQVNVATNLSYTDSTRVINSSTGTGATLPVAVAAGIAGLMTGADKTKLDGIAAGAQVNVATNLAQGTRTTTAVPITSSTGTSATLDIATTLLAGVMSSADKTKLDGIATGATANTGTVTGVTGTAPIASSGGTAPIISISAATQSAAGSMSSADKTKLDGIATGATANAGTVTSVSAGTQISGMAMTITNGTTTPSIATSVSNAANFRTAIGAGTGNGTVTSVTATSPIASSGGTTPVISVASGFTIPTSTEKGNYDTAYTDTSNATDANTASRIVKRDASGNFSAGTITAALTGTASGNITKTGSRTVGNIPTWDNTDGGSLGNGYTVETTLSGASTAIPRADAVKNYVDGLLSASDAMVFKGTVGTGGTFTIANFNALATYQAGWTYRVIEAGTIKGKVSEVGDLVIATVDRAGSSNVDADWTTVQTNIDGAVTGPASATSGNIATFNGTGGKIIQDGGASIETTLTTNSDTKIPTSKAVSTYVTGLGYTTNTGTITGVTAGTGLSGGGTSGTVTLDLDFSELTDMTSDISGTTEFILQDGTTESRKTANEIKLSNFNNDSGWTANTGTVTSVGGTGTVAGLTLSGTVTTTGNLTLGGTLSTPVSTINDSTTVGQNLVKLANPTAIRFIRINADNTVTARTDAEFRGDIGAGTSSTTGTVTSVGGTGTVSGLTLSGTVTTSGSLTLGGTLAVLPSNFASQTANTFLAAPNGTNGVPTFRAIVAADIPTLNQNTTGTSANVTGTVAVANGGTGATSVTQGGVVYGSSTTAYASTAIGTAGQVLTSNGTAAPTWSTISGTGTVTSVAASAGTGITISGSPITTTGTLTITNSAPDQTVALTGAGLVSTSGTYPNFTITGNADSNKLSLSGGTITGDLAVNGGGGDRARIILRSSGNLPNDLFFGSNGATHWSLTSRESGDPFFALYNNHPSFETWTFTVAPSTNKLNFTTVPSVGGNNIWHAGNDGSGSGLDADLLDGYNETAFVRLAANSSSPTNGTFAIGTSAGRNFIQSHSGQPLDINPLGNAVTIGGTSNTAWHAGNDGPGSTLDADTVDGIQGSSIIQTSSGLTTQTITGGSSGSATTLTVRNSSFSQAIGLHGHASASSESIGVLANGYGSSNTWGIAVARAADVNGTGLDADHIRFAGTRNNAGSNRYIAIQPASLGAIRTYTLPDAGADANFVMTEGTQTINGQKSFGSSLRAPDGLVGTPGITFTNDTNTGFYRSTADQIRVALNGVERIVLREGSTSVGGITFNTPAISGTFAMEFRYNGTTNSGEITVSSSNTTAYVTSSDYRLKTNIVDMDGPSTLSRIMRVKPREFTWLSDGKRTEGFIAHELQEEFPDAVIGIKDATIDFGNVLDSEGNIIETNYDYSEGLEESLLKENRTWIKVGSRNVNQGTDTSFMVAALVKAVQEQQKQIEELKSKILILEGSSEG